MLPPWQNICWSCDQEFLQERSCAGKRATICPKKECFAKRRRWRYRRSRPLRASEIEGMRWCAGGET